MIIKYSGLLDTNCIPVAVCMSLFVCVLMYLLLVPWVGLLSVFVDVFAILICFPTHLLNIKEETIAIAYIPQ